MSKQTFPSSVLNWLNERGITDETIQDAGLFWSKDKQAIVIPIYDHEGRYVFNKYRRNPNSQQKPKYWQDKGAKATLYGLQNENRHQQYTIVTEGELDCLVLQSAGFNAVTSTGGAGTFLEDWVPLLRNKIVYFVFDNDEAGMTGAQKAILKFTDNFQARIVFLSGLSKGGDVTDYVLKYGTDNLQDTFKQNAYMLPDWKPLRPPKNKTEARKMARQINFKLEMLRDLEVELGGKYAPKRIKLDYTRSWLNNQRNLMLRFSSKKEQNNLKNDIEKAKAVPIEQLYQGELKREAGNRLRGLCPFHGEEHASFVIYTNENRWYCYGACSTGGDSIDYVIARDNITFKEALTVLSNQKYE